MPIDKKPLREFINKPVVTKEGKRLGVVKDITFETRTGELIQLLLKELCKNVFPLQKPEKQLEKPESL